MSLTLKLEHDAPTDQGDTIPRGTTVGYLGHVIGGMVRVQWGPETRIIHPETTVELSSKSRIKARRIVGGIIVVVTLYLVGTARDDKERKQQREMTERIATRLIEGRAK